MTLEEFLDEWHNDDDSIVVKTSGSTGTPKLLRVEKRRMEASARMTLRFLGLHPGQTALLCMPLDYIAAKMMVVRALVGNLRLVSVDPSGHPLADAGVGDTPIDFAAMVPLQVYDTLMVPEERERLRKVGQLIIGGGAVSHSLARELACLPNPVWRTYGNNAPLLKTFLSPLYLPASSVTYENGQAVYRLYVYGEPSHLQGYRSYGSQWGIYEGLVSSDQLGFDIYFEPAAAEETDYMSGYRAINGATQVDNNDTEEENILDDAAAKAALDISSSVQHTTVTEDDIRAMMGSGGTTISSKTGDDVTTEHFEVGDFDDQSAGKVEH